MNEVQRVAAREGWSRPKDCVIAGVCAGIARRTGIDVTIVRVIALLMIPLPVSALLLYLIGWVVMPEDQPAPTTYRLRPNEYLVYDEHRPMYDSRR